MMATTPTGTSSSRTNNSGAEVDDKWLTFIGKCLTIVWTAGCVLIIAHFLIRVEQDIQLVENDWRQHLPSGATSSAIAEERRGSSVEFNGSAVDFNSAESGGGGYWRRKEQTEEENGEDEANYDDNDDEADERNAAEGQVMADDDDDAAGERGPRLSRLPDHILIIG
ncbi:hypothetical protein GPALN_006273 [Globodera pallida]|nr:hypothetical protein GPALN_006273 [Globodera pallida]